MSLWHKRLIIFLSKIFGVILLIIAIALFFYYYLYFKKDNLIKYVPANAILYSTFKLNNKLNENLLLRRDFELLKQDFNLPNLDYKDLNYMAGYNMSVAIIPEVINNEINYSYLLIIDFDGNANKARDLAQSFTENNWQAIVSNNQVVNKNIFLASNSAKTMQTVKKIISKNQLSLAQNINVQLNLNKFSLDYQGKIYFDFSYLADNLNNIKDIKTKLLIASLKADNLDNIYLGLKIKENKIFLQPLGFKNENQTSQPLMQKIPKNTGLIFNFNNGQKQFQKIYMLLFQTEQNYFNQLKKNKEYLEALYGFNLNNDILALFSNHAEIIADNDNHYILAINLESDLNITEKVNKLENIIKQYVAQQNPINKVKTLPDKTQIIQITKQPQNYNFQTEEINNVPIHYLIDSHEYAYFIQNNTLFLANSKEKLEKLANSEDLIDYNAFNNCQNNPELYIKNELMASYWPNLAKYIASISFLSTENGEFSLCLE
ncbi:MAG: hypothetical protein WC460_05590 [Patescibacteria group bacterium]